MKLVLNIWLAALAGFNFTMFLGHHRWMSLISALVCLLALGFNYYVDHKYGR